MLPIKSIVTLDKSLQKPVYLQIADAIIREIKMGRINPGEKLPGSRRLAEELEIHRNTAVTAYDELSAQGWIETIASKGTFVKDSIPDVQPRSFSMSDDQPVMACESGFPIRPFPIRINNRVDRRPGHLKIDQGTPDVRLTPVDELSNAYRRVMKRGLKLDYGDEAGDPHTREIISKYLNRTRGMHSRPDNLIITRGSQMAFYLSISTVINPGDHIIMAEKSYKGAKHIFRLVGAKVHHVPLDPYGIDVDAIEAMCEKQKIRAVYVIPHHQFPTTVSLCPERRVKLLEIAEKYGFAIIEDDYDFDFHYSSSPILPLASTDARGNVIYTGSFSKKIAPAFRVGYMIAPENVIQKAKKLRYILDRQGDRILERALAELIRKDVIGRHLRKSLSIYRKRRDYLCELLKETMDDLVEFTIPNGGMALWLKLVNPIDPDAFAQRVKTHGLYLHEETFYNIDDDRYAMRIGFASLNDSEIEQVVNVFEKVLRERT